MQLKISAKGAPVTLADNFNNCGGILSGLVVLLAFMFRVT